MQYKGLFVSATPDVGENNGGYYCQVYSDADMEHQVDDFCIHAEELRENPNVNHWIRMYIDGPTVSLARDAALTSIATRMIVALEDRGDLNPRNDDAEDYFTTSVWELKDALDEAYDLGAEHALELSPEQERGQRLVDELLGYLCERLDSSELYSILHEDLEMSHDDIDLLGFDLPQCYESEPSVSGQVSSDMPIYVAIFNAFGDGYALLNSYSEELNKRFTKECRVSLVNGDTLCFYGLDGQEVSDLMEATGSDYNYSYNSPEEAWAITEELPEPTNTKITYLYRDADNYKVFNECVVEGTLTDAQKKTILSCLSDETYFIPSQVGLPEQRFDDGITEADHCWFELDKNGFESTNQAPTIAIHATELVNAFCERKGRWDDAISLTSEKPSLSNQILSASTRAAGSPAASNTKAKGTEVER